MGLIGLCVMVMDTRTWYSGYWMDYWVVDLLHLHLFMGSAVEFVNCLSVIFVFIRPIRYPYLT